MVIPVVLRPVGWEPSDLGRLQALPREGKPVIMWPNWDQTLPDVANGVRKAVEALLRRPTKSAGARLGAGKQAGEGRSARGTLGRWQGLASDRRVASPADGQRQDLRRRVRRPASTVQCQALPTRPCPRGSGRCYALHRPAQALCRGRRIVRSGCAGPARIHTKAVQCAGGAAGPLSDPDPYPLHAKRRWCMGRLGNVARGEQG